MWIGQLLDFPDASRSLFKIHDRSYQGGFCMNCVSFPLFSDSLRNRNSRFLRRSGCVSSYSLGPGGRLHRPRNEKSGCGRLHGGTYHSPIQSALLVPVLHAAACATMLQENRKPATEQRMAFQDAVRCSHNSECSDREQDVPQPALYRIQCSCFGFFGWVSAHYSCQETIIPQKEGTKPAMNYFGTMT